MLQFLLQALYSSVRGVEVHLDLSELLLCGSQLLPLGLVVGQASLQLSLQTVDCVGSGGGGQIEAGTTDNARRSGGLNDTLKEEK